MCTCTWRHTGSRRWQHPTATDRRPSRFARKSRPRSPPPPRNSAQPGTPIPLKRSPIDDTFGGIKRDVSVSNRRLSPPSTCPDQPQIPIDRRAVPRPSSRESVAGDGKEEPVDELYGDGAQPVARLPTTKRMSVHPSAGLRTSKGRRTESFWFMSTHRGQYSHSARVRCRNRTYRTVVRYAR